MRTIVQKVLCGFMFLFVLSGSVYAGEIDVLMNKLVEKGILTPLEAQIIADETKTEVSKEVAAGKAYSAPRWVQKMEMKGDLRLRYQHGQKDIEGNVDRSRARYRMRLGVSTKVADGVDVAFGLATGGTDPRSTNETMDNSFETADIRIDYAYAKWAMADFFTLYGGKFKRKPVLWQTTDLMWDGDINPEGVAGQFKFGLGKGDFFVNTGMFVLDENKKDADPIMYVVQPGMKLSLTDNITLKTAVALYELDQVKDNTLDHSAGTNTLFTDADGDERLKYDYSVINPSVELGAKFEGPIKYAAVFADYVKNPDPDQDNTGYALGFKFGDKKVKKPGKWQAKYIYRKIEKDAWLDNMPDSDAYSGDTGVKGHEIALKYAIKKNVILGFDYYRMKKITEDDADRQDLFQFDVVFKF